MNSHRSKIHLPAQETRKADEFAPESIRRGLLLKGFDVSDCRKVDKTLEIVVASEDVRIAVSSVLRKWMAHYHYDAINVHVAETLSQEKVCGCCAGQVHDLVRKEAS